MNMKNIGDSITDSLDQCKEKCETNLNCAIFSYNKITKKCSLFISVTNGEYSSDFFPQDDTLFYTYVS